MKTLLTIILLVLVACWTTTTAQQVQVQQPDGTTMKLTGSMIQIKEQVGGMDDTDDDDMNDGDGFGGGGFGGGGFGGGGGGGYRRLAEKTDEAPVKEDAVVALDQPQTTLDMPQMKITEANQVQVKDQSDEQSWRCYPGSWNWPRCRWGCRPGSWNWPQCRWGGGGGGGRCYPGSWNWPRCRWGCYPGSWNWPRCRWGGGGRHCYPGSWNWPRCRWAY